MTRSNLNDNDPSVERATIYHNSNPTLTNSPSAATAANGLKRSLGCSHESNLQCGRQPGRTRRYRHEMAFEILPVEPDETPTAPAPNATPFYS